MNVDFKKNKPKTISLNWTSFSDYEKNLAKEIIDSNNYIYEEIGDSLNAIDKNIYQLIQCITKASSFLPQKNVLRNELDIRRKKELNDCCNPTRTYCRCQPYTYNTRRHDKTVLKPDDF